MPTKVILVILDGLRFDIAQSCMGYLSHLIEVSHASLYKVRAELPTLSRPLYEVLLTGTPASVNGITANAVARLSEQTSLFHLAAQQGLTTAAAAYYWFSELYNRSPFSPFGDREQHDLHFPIQHGKFYFDDTYPDSHLFADAEVLRQDWNPDFMLVHPMGIDYAGHRFGADSKDYRGRVLATDSLLAQYLPRLDGSGLYAANHRRSRHECGWAARRDFARCARSSPVLDRGIRSVAGRPEGHFAVGDRASDLSTAVAAAGSKHAAVACPQPCVTQPRVTA